MEGEVKNWILVWSTVVASLCYCHAVGKIFRLGIRRRLVIFPVNCLFFVLPLRLTTVNLGGVTSFFIAWLANFKLMLFAFNKGSLYSDPPLRLSRFVTLSCFPIKLVEQHSDSAKKSHQQHSPPNHATKIIFLIILTFVYHGYKKHIHPNIALFMYCIHTYFSLELLLALFGTLAKAMLRVELEPQFDKPYLATSLQDFWSRRWNLMVPNILRPTVYQPIRSISARLGRKWASTPAVVAAFLVSGLMHELVLYTFGRLRPTGEMMGFFLLHGVSVSAEIVAKKTLPGNVTRPLTLAYVIYTSVWLFFPAFMRAEGDLKACTELLAFVESVKTGKLVSPNQISCNL